MATNLLRRRFSSSEATVTVVDQDDAYLSQPYLLRTLRIDRASVDLFGFSKDDFIDQVQDIITVGAFYEKAAGGEIIFT